MKSYTIFIILSLIILGVAYLSCLTQHFRAADELAKNGPKYAEAELVFEWEDAE